MVVTNSTQRSDESHSSRAAARNNYNHNRFFGTELSTQDLENHGEQVEEKAPNTWQQQPQQKKTYCW